MCSFPLPTVFHFWLGRRVFSHLRVDGRSGCFHVRLLRTGLLCPFARTSWCRRAHAPWLHTQERNGWMIGQEKVELGKKWLSSVTPHERCPGCGCPAPRPCFSPTAPLWCVCQTPCPSVAPSVPSLAGSFCKRLLQPLPASRPHHPRSWALWTCKAFHPQAQLSSDGSSFPIRPVFEQRQREQLGCHLRLSVSWSNLVLVVVSVCARARPSLLWRTSPVPGPVLPGTRRHPGAKGKIAKVLPTWLCRGACPLTARG